MYTGALEYFMLLGLVDLRLDREVECRSRSLFAAKSKGKWPAGTNMGGGRVEMASTNDIFIGLMTILAIAFGAATLAYVERTSASAMRVARAQLAVRPAKRVQRCGPVPISVHLD